MAGDEQRKIVAPHLMLAELARDPAAFDKWVEENLLQRALAHLVARCGDSSVFLRALASGVLRVAVENAGGVEQKISGAGRAGVNIHDANTDARTLAIDAQGNAGSFLLSRDATLGAVLTFPGYGARAPLDPWKIDHAGGGVETKDLADAGNRCVVITVAAGPVEVYRSEVSGACEVPMGIANVYYPLVAATDLRYLDLDSSSAGMIHGAGYYVDQVS